MKKILYKLFVLIGITLLCFSVAACSGKSAYEIACENGFIGTQAEWLESLKGKDGRNGIDGIDGENGADIDIYDLFEAYRVENPLATFEEFLRAVLAADTYDIENAAAKGIRSVMSIWSQFCNVKSYDRWGNPTAYGTYYVGGAGVVYKSGGGSYYIITNYHVVYDYDSVQRPTTGRSDRIAEKIFIYTYGLGPSYNSQTSSYDFGTAIPAEFVGGAVSKDIAVIKADAEAFPDYVGIAETTDSNDVTVGERVVAVGNPLLEGIAVTSGIVSIDSEEIEMEALDNPSGSVLMRVIRTDTAINSGNSGGGLFNAKGRLLGIANAKTVETGVENMGYAIPVNVAAGIADCVMSNNSKKLALGITATVSGKEVILDGAYGRAEIYETVKVDSVTAGALADGKLQAGDILVSARLNGGEAFNITRLFHLSDFLYRAREGDALTLTVKRGGADTAVEMTAGSAFFGAV